MPSLQRTPSLSSCCFFWSFSLFHLRPPPRPRLLPLLSPHRASRNSDLTWSESFTSDIPDRPRWHSLPRVSPGPRFYTRGLSPLPAAVCPLSCYKNQRQQRVGAYDLRHWLPHMLAWPRGWWPPQLHLPPHHACCPRQLPFQRAHWQVRQKRADGQGVRAWQGGVAARWGARQWLAGALRKGEGCHHRHLWATSRNSPFPPEERPCLLGDGAGPKERELAGKE